MKLWIVVGITLLVTLSAWSIAVGDPGGWPAWRVVLATWPFGVLAGCIYLRLRPRS